MQQQQTDSVESSAKYKTGIPGFPKQQFNSNWFESECMAPVFAL